MYVAEEDPIDRKLLSALSMQLSSRIKGVNESPTDTKPYVVVRLHEMMAALAKGYGRLFTARGVIFDFESSVPDDMHVYALPDSLERAVENLLSNANKFTSDGGKATLRISAMHTFASIEVMVEVQDTGKGLSDDFAASIWDETYKGQMDSIGAGMGLPSVKAFASAEGGVVWSNANRSGRGCTIGFSFKTNVVNDVTETSVRSENLYAAFVGRVSGTFRWSSGAPCASCASPEKPPIRTGRSRSLDCSVSGSSIHLTTPPVRPPSPSPGHIILLVEDDPLQMRINAKKMKKYAPAGTCIDLATEGSQGLDCLRAKAYSAVISDMNMPVMDGATMIKIARSEGCLPAITKLLSAQTFPAAHFDSFGISADMMYDKTDAGTDAFKDVSREL
jgi:CheY-like chemotaxis protein